MEAPKPEKKKLTPEEQARINEPSSGLRYWRPEWERQQDSVQAQ